MKNPLNPTALKLQRRLRVENLESRTMFAISPLVTEQGMITLSVDGLGTLSTTGTIQVNKPAGATVRSAYLAAATTGFELATLADGDIEIDGVGVNWDASVPSTIDSFNYWADVTSIVQATIDGAPTGLVDFTITEADTDNTDGVILAVIFDDPNQLTENTVILLFGAQNIEGETFTVTTDPINTSDPDLAIDMSLGISFGFQGNEQSSEVEINGIRLTSSAGGDDDGDGSGNDGSLITVGGIGDTNDNPADPNSGPNFDPRQDDELYSLLPFVSNGDTSINVFTQDTQTGEGDDNIFFAAFYLQDLAGSVGDNVAPVAEDIDGPSKGVPGQPLDFSTFFTDLDLNDTHTAVINWGDGTQSEASIDEFDGEGEAFGTHVYAKPGNYTVSFVITDSFGNESEEVTQQVSITTWAICPDDCYGGTALFIGGTNKNDIITVAGSSKLVVTINGKVSIINRPSSRIVIYGQGGNDKLLTPGVLSNPVWLFGGDGNDTLASGRGNDVLVGGYGNDTLNGGAGRNLLIGSQGSDSLYGLAGNSILVADQTAWDANDMALCAIIKEWSSKSSYSSRVSRLNSPDTLQFNLSSNNVFADNSSDCLVGGLSGNWFLANISGQGKRDKITARWKSDIATDTTTFD